MQHNPVLTIADTERLLDEVRAKRPGVRIWTEATGRGVAYCAQPKGDGSWSVMSGSLERFLLWLRDC